MLHRVVFAFLLAALLGSLSGCLKTEEDKTVEKAREFIDARNFNQALITLKEALKKDPENIRYLREQVLLFLRSGQISYASAAYRKLDKHSPADTVLIDTLSDKDSIMRIAAVKTLADLSDPTLAQHLLPLTSDKEKKVRRAVIDALGDLRSEKAVPVLIKMLTDKSWFIRAEAATALGKIGNSEAAAKLFELMQDPDQYVRDNARKALQALSTPENKEAYLHALKDSNPNIRLMAALSLAENSDPAGASILIEQINDAPESTTIDIIKAIKTIEATEAVPKLRPLIDHPSATVRIHAILTLGWLRDIDSKATFRKLSKDESEESRIRMAALQAVNLIERPKK